MDTKGLKKFKIKLFLLLTLSSLVWVNSLSMLLAQTSQKSSNRNIVFVPAKEQPDPPNHGTPETEEGTGSRGDCPYKENLPPPSSLVGNKSLISTINEYPSFWIYVPYSASEVAGGEFILQDGERDLYRTQLELPDNIPGIVEVKLPPTSKPLKVGKKYRWYFEVDCSEEKNKARSVSFVSLTGIVCLVSPSGELNRELDNARTSLESIEIFAKHGIWYETLTQLIHLRSQEPENAVYRRLWHQLLTQAQVDKGNLVYETFAGQATVNLK